MASITRQGGDATASKKRLAMPMAGALVRHARMDIRQKVIFMVAHEKYIGGIFPLQTQHEVEHTFTVRSAVNVIAEKDQAICGWIVVYSLKQAHSLVEASMNIANSIIHAWSFPVRLPTLPNWRGNCCAYACVSTHAH